MALDIDESSVQSLNIKVSHYNLRQEANMSLRFVPSSAHSTSTTNTSSSTTKGAPSAPGLHDTLRSSLASSPSMTSNGSPAPISTHPLESRLAQWQATQESLKMNILRRNFGIAEPVRRGMEAKICKEGEWRPTCLGGSANVGGEVLAGRDTEICWEDVYRGDESCGLIDFHTEMEGKVGMERW